MPQRIDKEELAKRIRELEGLNNDEKSTLLELLNSSKKYGLVWEEKVENTEEALRDNLPVLAEDKTLALTNGGEDAPNHILIEGETTSKPSPPSLTPTKVRLTSSISTRLTTRAIRTSSTTTALSIARTATATANGSPL